MLKLDRPADFALKALYSGDRDLVNAAVARLRRKTSGGIVPPSFGRYSVRRLADGLNLLTVRQRFGIFFREEDGDIVVLDIFPVARLRAMEPLERRAESA